MERRQFLSSLVSMAVLGQSSEKFGNLIEDSSAEVFVHPLAKRLKSDPLTGKVLKSTMGYASTVRIDLRRGIVQKKFLVDGICIGGARPNLEFNSYSAMKRAYEKEKHALSLLKGIGSRYIPRDLKFNDDKLEIVSSFGGYDLLIGNSNHNLISDKWCQNIVDMSHEYRKIGIMKQTISLSHLVDDYNQGNLVALDFKWWEKRTRDPRIFEIKSNIRWLHRLHPELTRELLKTMTDMRPLHDLEEEHNRWLENIYYENSPWMKVSSNELINHPKNLNIVSTILKLV